MRMKKATAFGLAALMAATMIPAVPAMAKGDDSEGSVYYLNFKPEQADQWSDLAKKYTDETGVPVTVVTAASGTYESTLKSEMAKDEVPTLFQVNGPVGLASWKDYCYDLKDSDVYKNVESDDFVLKEDSGAVDGIAYVIETYGIIYNKALLKKFLEGIQTLNHQGSTIIYTSHYMEEVEQICTRIAIMDHGRVIAQGTKEELKQMIKTGETITVEAIALEEKNLRDIRTLEHVFDVQYKKQVLVVRCTDAKHNLIRLLNYLQSQDISFGRVFSELPTLNDVFLEITGKQLRD